MYTFDSRVRYSETDERGTLTLTGIMNYLQDCSTFHSEDVGLGFRYLEKNSRAWWLSSWQIVIDRYPVMGEEITVGTWPYDFKGIYGYRNFVICDREGGFLVRANSVWFFYDTEHGRPVRVTESDVKGYGSGEARLSMVYAPGKISVPPEFYQAAAVVVGRGHIDTNHHVNNAQYVEIAREALPGGIQVSELRAEYRKAAVLGDKILPRIGESGDGYVVSLCDEKGAPYAVICLKNREDNHD